MQTTKTNTATAEKPLGISEANPSTNPIKQTEDTTSKGETLPQEPGYLPKSLISSNSSAHPVCDSTGVFIFVLIVGGILCVGFGFITAYNPVEVDLPSRSLYGLTTTREKVVPIPQIVQGLLWAGTGVFQLLLALLLLIWNGFKRLLENLAKLERKKRRD